MSYRLHGTKRLTSPDVRAIVRALADWGAISTQAEATELLAMTACPPFSAAEWAAPPLDQLTAADPTLPPNLSHRPPPVQHQPESQQRVVGRETELAALHDAVQHHALVAITGVGGIGKSTLAAMYTMQSGYPFHCWRNLHHNASFADFVEAALAMLGQVFDVRALPRPAEQANYLIAVLRHIPREQGANLLIVLNNFESVMDAAGVETGWAEFLELALVGGLGTSRVLLTTRDLPRSRQGQEPHCFALGGLTIADGLALLMRLGVTAEAELLTRAVQQMGGHPLALVFLTDLIDNQGYTLAELIGESAWQERIAERLLDLIYRKLTPAQQRTLQYFSLFDAPTAPATVAGMLAAHGEDAATMSAAQIRRLADALADRSLLQRGKGRYQAHPIVCAYAHHQMPDPATYHRAAAAYFRALYQRDPHTDPPRSVVDVQPLLDALDQLLAAADYQAAYLLVKETPLEYRGGDWVSLNPLLSRWGEYGRLVSINQRIAAAPFAALDDISRGRILGNLGIIYLNLGQAERAIPYYQQAMEIAERHADMVGKAAHLGNLGNAYRRLGDFRQAIAYHQQAYRPYCPTGRPEGQERTDGQPEQRLPQAGRLRAGNSLL